MKTYKITMSIGKLKKVKVPLLYLFTKFSTSIQGLSVTSMKSYFYYLDHYKKNVFLCTLSFNQNSHQYLCLD